jgi:hypothetical protein
MSGHDFPEVAADGDVGEQLEHIVMILERISAQLTALEGAQESRTDFRRLLEEIQGLRRDLSGP